MPSIIDAIRRTFGEDLGPDLIAESSNFTRQQYKKLLREYVEVQRNIECPPKKNSELRPFIHYKWSEANLLPFDVHHFKNPSIVQQEDVIKKLLLYAHGVCISDPGDYILRLATYDGGLASGVFQNYLIFLNQIKILLDNEIVILIDDYPLVTAYNNILTIGDIGPREMLPSRTKVLKWPPGFGLFTKKEELEQWSKCWEQYLLGPVKNALGNEVSEREINLILDAFDITLIADRLFDSRIDPFFLRASDRTVTLAYLDFLKQYAGIEGNITIPDSQLRALSSILSLELPNLASVSIEDIVTIRRSSDGFATWRSALDNALLDIHRLPVDLLDKNEAELRVIRNGLLEAKTQVEKELHESSFLSKTKPDMLTFTVGAITAASLTPLFSPAEALASGGVTLALTLLHKFAHSGNESTSSKEAKLRHFGVFE